MYTHLSNYLRISNTVISNLEINDIKIPKQKECKCTAPHLSKFSLLFFDSFLNQLLLLLPTESIPDFHHFFQASYPAFTYLADYITSIERLLGQTPSVSSFPKQQLYKNAHLHPGSTGHCPSTSEPQAVCLLEV